MPEHRKQDEREDYPYYLFFKEDKLKAMDIPEVRAEADHAIGAFVNLIEQEKVKSEMLAKRLDDLNLEVLLLARPPLMESMRN